MFIYWIKKEKKNWAQIQFYIFCGLTVFDILTNTFVYPKWKKKCVDNLESYDFVEEISILLCEQQRNNWYKNRCSFWNFISCSLKEHILIDLWWQSWIYYLFSQVGLPSTKWHLGVKYSDMAGSTLTQSFPMQREESKKIPLDLLSFLLIQLSWKNISVWWQTLPVTWKWSVLL